MILYLLVDAEESLWLSPKAGSGRDRMPLTAKVSRSVFIGWAQKQARTSQTPSTCLSEVMWGGCHPTRAGPIPCCSFPTQLCVALTRLRPYPIGCVHFCRCINMTGKIHVTAHGYNSNISSVTVNFMALFLLEDLVTRQLLYNS